MKRLILVGLILLKSSAYSQNTEAINQEVILNGYTKKPMGRYYGNRDVIWGNVMTMVEKRYIKYKTSKKIRLPDDTLHFDTKGNITRYNLPIDFLSSNTYKSKYFDKYGAQVKKVEAIGDTAGQTLIDIFDKNGDRVGVELRSKDGDRYRKELYKFDVSGKIIEFTTYKTKDTIEIKEEYKYNAKELPIKVQDYLPNGKLEESVSFFYDAFDLKGNWIKRIETRKSPSGKTTGTVTTERQIIYY